MVATAMISLFKKSPLGASKEIMWPSCFTSKVLMSVSTVKYGTSLFSHIHKGTVPWLANIPSSGYHTCGRLSCNRLKQELGQLPGSCLM